MSSDTALTGVIGLNIPKNGTPPGGNDPFPAGDACVFGGVVFG